jgi:hypothetical protein
VPGWRGLDIFSVHRLAQIYLKSYNVEFIGLRLFAGPVERHRFVLPGNVPCLGYASIFLSLSMRA